MEKGQPAFLLAQLGAHAASQFAERLGVLDLTPPDAGILRLLRIAAGLSQQELAAKLTDSSQPAGGDPGQPGETGVRGAESQSG